MKTKAKSLPTALLLTCVAAGMLAGCQPGSSTTAQAVPVAQADALSPEVFVFSPAKLDEKALVHLDKLTPEIARPVNPAGASTMPSQQTEQLLRDAQEKLALRQWGAALELLDRAVGFQPDNAIIHKGMARAYIGQGSLGKALASLKQAARLMPDDLEAHLLIGKITASQPRQRDVAMTALRTALMTSQAKPENPAAAEALWMLGQVLATEKYFTAALDCYQQLSEWLDAHKEQYISSPALKTHPLLQSLLLQRELLLTHKAAMLVELGRAKEAVVPLSKAYNENRGSTIIARLLVGALTMDKQYDKAQSIILQMASQPEVQGQVAPLAAMLAKASGNKQLPMKIWQASGRSGKVEVPLGLAMARVSGQLGDQPQAQAILESILEKVPQQLEAGRMLAGMYGSAGKTSQALRLLARLIQAHPQNDIELIRSIRLMAAGAAPQAETEFATSIASAAGDDACALHYVAGQFASARDNQTLAGQQYELALKADGNFLPTYDAMMDLHIETRNESGKAKLLEAADTLDDASFAYFKSYLSGKKKLAGGDVEGAVKDLEQSRSQANHLKKPFVPTLVLLGRALNLAKQEDAAIRVLEEAREVQSDNETLYRYLVELLMAQGRYVAAQEHVSALLKSHPDSVLGRVMQAELWFNTGKKDQAQQQLRQLKATDGKNLDVQILDFRLEYGGRLSSLKKAEFAPALKRLTDIFKLDPANDGILRTLTQLLDHPSRRAEAADVLGRLYEETGKPLNVAQAYAVALVRAEKYDKAQSVLEELLKSNPSDARLRRMMLATLTKLKKNTQAAELAKQYLEDAQDEDARAAYRQLVLSLYEETAQYDKAQVLLDEQIDLSADRRALLELRGKKLRLYAKAKQYDKLVEYGQAWTKELADEPRIAENVRWLMVIELREGKQFDKAIELLQEWIGSRTDASADDMRAMRIALLGEAGKLDDARKLALEWIKASPSAKAPRAAIIAALSDAEKFEQAQQLAEEWLSQSDPQHPAALAASAGTTTLSTQSATAPVSVQVSTEVLDFLRTTTVSMLLMAQKHPQAIKRADFYLTLYDRKAAPSTPDGDNPVVRLYELKSMALNDSGHRDQALKTLEEIYEAQSDDPGINNDLGYMYADMGIELEKAEKMIRLALAGAGNRAALQDSLAWVLYKQGRFADAARVFDAVLDVPAEQQPKNSIIWDHAGDTYFRLGDKDKAVKLWTTALEKAKTEKPRGSEPKKVLSSAPGKIDAARKGGVPNDIAPLGKDVKLEE